MLTLVCADSARPDFSCCHFELIEVSSATDASSNQAWNGGGTGSHTHTYTTGELDRSIIQGTCKPELNSKSGKTVLVNRTLPRQCGATTNDCFLTCVWV